MRTPIRALASPEAEKGGRVMATKKKLPSRRKGAPTPTKARKMLREGEAHGKKLTKKQKGFLGAIAGRDKK